jgi:hypothetical protein
MLASGGVAYLLSGHTGTEARHHEKDEPWHRNKPGLVSGPLAHRRIAPRWSARMAIYGPEALISINEVCDHTA